MRRYYQQLTRFSAIFGLIGDVCIMLYGGELKRKEKLSARLGDVLSMLYMSSAVLKRYYDEGEPKESMPLVKWACKTLLLEARSQVGSILRNFPNKWLGLLLRVLVFPLGQRLLEPSDKTGHQVAKLFINPTQTRERLVKGAYITPDDENPVGMLDEAFRKVIAVEDIEKRVHQGEREGTVTGLTVAEKAEAAIKANILTQAEADQLLAADAARLDVISVDDFDPKELSRERN